MSQLPGSDHVQAKVRHYIRRWFAKRIGAEYVFHDLEHTMSVTRIGLELGRAEDLDNEHLKLLEIALLFHDTGYAQSYEGHEEKSVQIARAYLKKKLRKEETDAIEELIMATRMHTKAKGTMQDLVRDADSSKAGQADFFEKAERLRAELAAVKNETYSNRGWSRMNLAYLEGHRFHTRYAQERFGPQKAINIATLKERLSAPKQEFVITPVVQPRFFDRDLSWLSFNDRVLQEARDPQVPLLERLKFLAIYSSNLDEFYRVRVAALRSLIKLKPTERTALGVPPEELLDKINAKALKQLKRFGKTYRNKLLPSLGEQGISMVQVDQLDPVQLKWVLEYFEGTVKPLVNIYPLDDQRPFLEDRQLYLVCSLRVSGKKKAHHVLLNIPSDRAPRFLKLPTGAGMDHFIYLDDVIRAGLSLLIPDQSVVSCNSIKLTRDADLYLKEEFAESVADRVQKSLSKRITGVPSRFLFDGAMPRSMQDKCRLVFDLATSDMIPGGRYHNFSDLFTLPIEGRMELRDPEMPPLPHPLMHGNNDLFTLLDGTDVMLHFPYQRYQHVVDLLLQAANDVDTEHIYITLYRVAKESHVCHALLKALENGHKVTVVIEVQARFDERSNLKWGNRLQKAGANVLFGYEDIKVHCKLCLIERKVRGKRRSYAYFGTGNFNERTADLYADVALITTDPKLTSDAKEVFAHLLDRSYQPRTEHVLMAPIELRSGVERMIDEAIHAVSSGQKVALQLKMNSLEDHAMISKLYTASQAGVKIRAIVRGICCLVPGIEGLSDNIKVISIVDRFLEHARLFIFKLGDEKKVYLGSADLMGRNLDRRVEVMFPVFDPELQQELQHMFDLQWRDNVKARRINVKQDNPYKGGGGNAGALRSQVAFYELLKERIGTSEKGAKEAE